MSNKNKPDKKNNSPGFILKKARESQNLSQDYIAGQLRLSIEIIEALESDLFERLPAPIFVRGYLRNYATILGVSGGRVIECYTLILGDDVHEASLATVRMKDKATSSVTSGVKKYLPLAAIGLLVLLGLILWLSSSRNVENEPVLTEKPVVNKEDVLPEKRGTVILPVDKKPVVSKPEPKPAPSPVEKPVQLPVPTKALSPEKPKADTPEPSAKSGEDTLKFSFSNSSWVDVRDSQGKRMIYRMVKSGSEYTVTGKPPIRITLGNAHGIVLKRNGTSVDLLPFIRGNVARFSLGHAGN